MHPMTLYSRAIALVVLFCVTLGIVVPYLVSAESTMAVTVGIILLIALGPTLYMIGKPLIRFTQANSPTKKESDTDA